jgi:HhH-GPD superfamily base excision DNA repair protein
MKIALTPDGPLDVRGTLSRYHRWGDDPTNQVGDDVFRRVLRVESQLVPYEVRWTGSVDDARIVIRIPGARGDAISAAAIAEVRRILGLDFDLTGFYRMAQQINLSFAFACRARLVRRYGTPVRMGRETVWAFPEAARLARARPQDLRALKYSTRKAEYIRDLARAIVAGTIDLEAVCLEPTERVITRLTDLRGLGRWTADWFLARCLGRGDVCPAGDLAVRKAFDHYYGRGRALSETAIRRRADTWGQHQNLAVHYMLAGMRLTRPAVGGGT